MAKKRKPAKPSKAKKAKAKPKSAAKRKPKSKPPLKRLKVASQEQVEKQWLQLVAQAWDDAEAKRKLVEQPTIVLKEKLKAVDLELPHATEEIHVEEITEHSPQEAGAPVKILYRLPPKPTERELVEKLRLLAFDYDEHEPVHQELAAKVFLCK